MSTYRLIIIFLFFSIIGLSANAQDETPQQLIQFVQSSLVEVTTIDSKSIDEGGGHIKVGTYHSQGSGVIIDSQGIIVTNTHIIAGVPHIYVGLPDGTKQEAKLVYSSDADFSFITIEPAYPLQAITWADSSQAPVGTPIIGLSYADGQQHILSGQITNLINGKISNNIELIELNLNLVPGDSGGPLLDNQGHLLGLVMAKLKDQDNKSYAIASNKIQQEYQEYKNKSDSALLL